MGSTLSAIRDDYEEYVIICNRLNINAKEFNSWEYDDFDIVKLIDNKGYTYKQAEIEVELNRKKIEITRLIDHITDVLKSTKNILSKIS